MWLAPTGMASWTGSSPGLPWDMGRNPWWLHDANWTHWAGRVASDVALLRQSLGGGGNASAIVYFPAFLADVARWGAAPLERLDSVVASLAAGGVRPQLLIGRPDVGASGEWLPSSDPVHDPAARAWLTARVRDVLALPAVQREVVFVSVYWMGASSFCAQGGGCSEAEVADYNAALADTVAAAGTRFRLLLHLDGMFQDACWPVPCASWDYHGYTPRSVNGSWGLLVESWVQGSLRPAIQRLYDEGVTSADRLLLLQDLRNCDQPGVPACVMGSVQADVDAWFDALRQLGLCSSDGSDGSAAQRTFGVWAFADVPPRNEFGDALANGTGLTAKGAANRAKALSPAC